MAKTAAAKRPKTGGRKAGVPNKATREIREIAQGFAPAAIREAARLAKSAKTEAARIGAINIILDRAYGKPAQAVAHSGSIGTFDPSKLTDDELATLEPILARLAIAGGGPSGDGEAGG